MAYHPPRQNVYQNITQHLIAEIEAGARTWQMPWHIDGTRGVPQNAQTKRIYRGVNVIVLWATAQRQGFDSDYWATYRQWQRLGAQVRKGEHGTTVLFYKPVDQDDADDKEPIAELRRVVTRAHRVFNAAQVDGWSNPKAPQRSLVASLAAADQFVTHTGADIRHGGNQAFYAPVPDYIRLPDREQFMGTDTSDATESYYSTTLHELIHWSGHPNRLDRNLSGRFGAEAYALEELVAELGAAFLCGHLEISNVPRPDHAAYLSNWLVVMRCDARAFFTAANRATQAADYLLMLQQKTS